MYRRCFAVVIMSGCLMPMHAAAERMGPGFTYQGRLDSSGTPLTGTADFQFSLYDAPGTGTIPPSGGTQIGAVQSVANVPVRNGLFMVMLNESGEFGDHALIGELRWLHTAVRSPAGAGPFVTLGPRQLLTGAPFALHALGPWVSSGTAVTYYPGQVGIGNFSFSGAGFYPEYPLHVTSAGGILVPGGGGLVVIGRTNSYNLALDTDEIVARNSGQGSRLMLNRGGGDVMVGPTGNARLTVGDFPFFIDPNAGVHVHWEPNSTGGTLELQGDTHAYMSFFPNGPAVRKAWFGFGGAGTTEISLVNEAGGIILAPLNGAMYISGLTNIGDHHNVQWDDSGLLGYDNSTRRDKENITLLRDNFERLLDVNPVTYTRPGNPGRWEIGFIAEEINDLGLTRLLLYDGEGRPDAVNYEKSVLYLVEIAKSQRQKIQAQQAQIDAQQARIDELGKEQSRLAEQSEAIRRLQEQLALQQNQIEAIQSQRAGR